MLEAFCELIAGLSDANDGVECILNRRAYNGLIRMTREVYGDHAADVLANQFTERDGDIIVCVMEEADDAFRLCLTGVG